MKRIKQVFIYTIVFVIFVHQANAAPSAEILQQFTQTDGAIVAAIQKGDEWNNWIETASGYTIEKAADGNWYYVTGFDGTKSIMMGRNRADLPPPAGLKRGIRPKCL